MRLLRKVLTPQSHRQGLAVVAATCLLVQQSAQAAGPNTPTTLPTAGSYVAGGGSIKTSGNAVIINQSTLRGIIDWTTFSIGANGSVTFKNGTGATLNRVTGNEMSSILGSLFSSGSVYVLNPQGILIGRGAHINTNGDFVASSLDLTNNTFMSGSSPLFRGESKSAVVNLGDLFSKNGSILLVGHAVSNSGSIKAANGTAALAAGSEVLFKDTTGNQRVFVQAVGSDVTNTGVIKAAQVELKAKGGNIYALAGNSGGAISANGTAQINGHAWLISDGGTTQISGLISARNANGLGGDVETSGHYLDVSHASVKTGQGGNWLLDPVDVLIDGGAATTIQNSLATTNVTVQTTATSASGPGVQSPGSGDITVASNITWASNNALTLSAYRDVDVNAGITIKNTGAGSLMMRADNTSNGTGAVNFGAGSKLDWSQSTGIASVLYDPVDEDVRYDSPLDYSGYFVSNSSWTAPANHSVSSQLTAYMLVNNATDLAALPNTGTYALGTDLDLSSNTNFPELGLATGFSGVLDGFGHTISGLTMLVNDAPLGLFDHLAAGGIIRNLNFTNMSVTDASGDPGHLGGLVGDNEGTVANVVAGGSVQNLNSPALTGGVVGDNTATGLIYNVQSSVVVDETYSGSPQNGSAIGGLAGSSEGIIQQSASSGTITGHGNYNVGGLVGANSGLISASSSSSTVTGQNEGSLAVGGLLGSNDGVLTSVSASGSVTASADSGVAMAGGLIGKNSVALTGLTETANVSATSSGAQVGGLVGHNDGSIANSSAHGTVTAGAYANAGGLAGFTGAVTASSASGSVTAGDDSTVGGLTGWSYFTTISGGSATGAVTAGAYSTIGGLSGRVDGAVTNSTATGTIIADHDSTAGGLIGISNSTVDGSSATGTISTGGYSTLGGLIGSSTGAVTNSHATGSVSAPDNDTAGGLIGSTTTGVSSSYATGTVHTGGNGEGGTNALGGLIGVSSGNTNAISDSHAIGTVTTDGGGSVGGLIGSNNAPVNNVYANGNVSAGAAIIGGLIGENSGAVTGATASGTVAALGNSDAGGLVGMSNAGGSIANSSASGATSAGNNSNIGGLAAEMHAAVTGSYATGSVTGGTNGHIGGLVGYTDSAVTGSHATGNVLDNGAFQGPNFTGGLVGQVDSSASVQTSYATGSVTSTGSNGSIGGLVGELNGSVSVDSSATGAVSGGNSAWIGGLVGESNVALSGFTMTNVNVHGGNESYVGALVGHSTSSISQSTSSGAVTADGGATAGGLVGYAGGLISNSSSSASVISSDYSAIGGLAGEAHLGISGSSATGNVAGGFATGGLVGISAGDISSSFATGTVTVVVQQSDVAGVIAGGLVGILGGNITNSYATGSVTAGTSLPSCEGPCNMVGGLVGWITGGMAASNIHATGNVSADAAAVGGLIGEDDTAALSNAYATGNVHGGDLSAAGGLVGTAFSNIDQSYATGTVTTGSANSACGRNCTLAGGLVGYGSGMAITNSHSSGAIAGGAYSTLGGLAGGGEINVSQSYATGSVTGTTGAYAGGLMGVNTGSTDNSYATGAVTIGTGGYVGGLLAYADGAAATITNSHATGLVTGGTDIDAGGLVAYSGAAISHSYATGNVVSGGDSNTGGLAGENYGAIDHSYALGSVVAGGDDSYVGGLSGDNVGGVNHSYATGNVTAGTASSAGGDVGGLTGNSTASISTSYATGAVSSLGQGAYVGGLAGQMRPAAIVDQSYSIGSVSSNGAGTVVGGLVGDTRALVSNSYALGSVTAAGTGSSAGGLVGKLDTASSGTPAISSSYSVGHVSGATTNGGLVGVKQGGTVTSSFWDTTTSGQASSAGGTGLTTKQWLAAGPVAANASNWNFTNIWVKGYPYPVLKAFPYVVATITPGTARIYGGADPTFSISSALDQNASSALTRIQGSLVAITPVFNANVGTYNFGGSNQYVTGSQLTYLGNLTIDPATLTLTGSANTKIYNGNAAATLDLGSLGLSGLVAGDSISLNSGQYLAAFLDKNAGSSKAVNVSGLTLTGTDLSNYIFAPNQVISGSITPAALTETFSANNKTYDGTTIATAALGTLSGVVGNDSVSVLRGSFAFSDRNAGTGKAVAGSNGVLSGPDAGNYVVSFVQTGTASITPAPLYYVANSGVTRGFGSDNPVLTGTVFGLVGGDTLSSVTSGTALFGTSAVNSSSAGLYGVTGSGLSLTSGNYTLRQAAANASAFSINPITITINNAVKFSGSPNPTFTINYSGPGSSYLQNLLANLVLITNAPRTDAPGIYQITAMLPEYLANSIIVKPGSFIINSLNNSLVQNNTPQVVATRSASLESQPAILPFVLPTLTGGGSTSDQLMPGNAIGQFQIVFNPMFDATVQTPSADKPLADASFTQTSPDGHSNLNKSTYAAGAQK